MFNCVRYEFNFYIYFFFDMIFVIFFFVKHIDLVKILHAFKSQKNHLNFEIFEIQNSKKLLPVTMNKFKFINLLKIVKGTHKTY